MRIIQVEGQMLKGKDLGESNDEEERAGRARRKDDDNFFVTSKIMLFNETFMPKIVSFFEEGDRISR